MTRLAKEDELALVMEEVVVADVGLLGILFGDLLMLGNGDDVLAAVTPFKEMV